PGGDVVAVLLPQVDLEQAQPALLGEPAGVVARVVAVLADAEAHVEAVRVVAEPDEQVPDGERVLPARHGDEDPFARGDHVELVDGLLHLVAAEPQEVLGAEVRVRASDVDDRPVTAHAALHRGATSAGVGSGPTAPPEMTGRISIRSSSSSLVSPGTISPLRMTSTDSRFSSSRSSRTETSIGPSTVTSRRGLRRCTITSPMMDDRSPPRHLA